jgi:hypothetical protein
MEFLPANFNRIFANGVTVRQIYPSLAHRGAERQSRECLLLLEELSYKDCDWGKSWCYTYDPETKQASSQWKNSNSPRPKKARQVRSNVKTMLICFFDVNGIVHKEFVPPGQTVNQYFYLDVLKRLCDSVRRKRPEMWRSADWLLHHDNAPAHMALSLSDSSWRRATWSFYRTHPTRPT